MSHISRGNVLRGLNVMLSGLYCMGVCEYSWGWGVSVPEGVFASVGRRLRIS